MWSTATSPGNMSRPVINDPTWWWQKQLANQFDRGELEMALGMREKGERRVTLESVKTGTVVERRWRRWRRRPAAGDGEGQQRWGRRLTVVRRRRRWGRPWKVGEEPWRGLLPFNTTSVMTTHDERRGGLVAVHTRCHSPLVWWRASLRAASAGEGGSGGTTVPDLKTTTVAGEANIVNGDAV